MSVVRRFSAGTVGVWLILVVGGFLSLFPFFWMLIGTTLNPNDVIRGIVVPGPEFPLNWVKANKNYNLPLFFTNSLKIALLTVFFGVIVNALAAFGFEKFRSKSR
jgi:lactose/L-arabinose transport system permease protein